MCELDKWKLQFWLLAPYTESTNDSLGGVIYHFITNATKSCCGNVADEDLQFSSKRYDNQQSMLEESLNLSIAFPMICTSMSLANAPSEFVRLFQTDGLVQVTRRRDGEGNILTNGVWTVWPIFVTIIILTGYAAILLWLSEFSGSIRTFNRKVLKGLFEGYWFAFVSATTVGYGDKVPGTVLGKCIAMFWILCGICVTSAFTAAITTLLSTYQQSLNEMAPLDDGKVGVLRGTVDKELLLQKNARIYEYDSLGVMIDALKNKVVDSLVMDHFFYAHYRGANFNDNVYLRRHSVTQPTTVGVIFNVKWPSGLLECIRKQAFLAHLKIADDVAESVGHTSESEGKDLFEETAQNLFGNTNLPLIVMASVLLGIGALLLFIDRFSSHLAQKRRDGGESCTPNDTQYECFIQLSSVDRVQRNAADGFNSEKGDNNNCNNKAHQLPADS